MFGIATQGLKNFLLLDVNQSLEKPPKFGGLLHYAMLKIVKSFIFGICRKWSR
jgi:hypothetical protein